jgi:hypothetical protein
MRKLSVLVIHNQYQQPGGEDVVVRAEVDLLRGRDIASCNSPKITRRWQTVRLWKKRLCS